MADIEELVPINVDRWFAHTSFGCMKSKMVTHFEPSVTCAHRCAYCYVVGYVCPQPRKPSEAMSLGVSDETIIRATCAKAAKMMKMIRGVKEGERYFGARRLIRGVATEGEFWDGEMPELHMSISTDCLQPVPVVQDRSFLVMRTWLEQGLLLSVVSKGVPHSPELRGLMLALFAKHKAQVSFQVTCATSDVNASTLLEPGAPLPEVRFKWLAELVAAGIAHASLRMNPLVPGINDSDEQMINTAKCAVGTGVRAIAISYMYGKPSIFREMGKRGLDMERIVSGFEKNKFALKGGAPKQHVFKCKRLHAHNVVATYAKAFNITTTSCGCDNQDIFPDDKCGICWRSR
jgi:DNA repair photolyase